MHFDLLFGSYDEPRTIESCFVREYLKFWIYSDSWSLLVENEVDVVLVVKKNPFITYDFKK